MTTEFVDTNVLVYAHDSSAGTKRLKAKELISRLTIEQNGALSLQVLAEFYDVVTRKQFLDWEEAEQAVDDFGAWRIHCPTHKDLIRASKLRRRDGIGWWDAMIVNSAEQLECSILWTEDFNDGQQYGFVTVRNPFRD